MPDLAIKTAQFPEGNQTVASVGPMIIAASFISVINTMPSYALPNHYALSNRGLSGYNLVIADNDEPVVTLAANYLSKKTVGTANAHKEKYVPMFRPASDLDTWS